jgi:hypothetical protein
VREIKCGVADKADDGLQIQVRIFLGGVFYPNLGKRVAENRTDIRNDEHKWEHDKEVVPCTLENTDERNNECCDENRACVEYQSVVPSESCLKLSH